MHDLIHVHLNELQRRGLIHMLRETVFRVVASVASIAEGLKALDGNPDAILVTEMLFDGVMDLTALIEAKRRKRHAIVFGASENPRHVLLAREENALDYIFFTVSREQLIERLTRAAEEKTQGGQFANMRLLAAVDLSPRETDVIKQLALGSSNKEIAQTLGISYETVKEHVQHLLRKIGVNDRTQAAVWWTRQQLS